MRKIYLLLICAFILGCKNKTDDFSKHGDLPASVHLASASSAAPGNFENGTYCATLRYYDNRQRTNMSCPLLVELENNQITHLSKSDCNSFDESAVTTMPVSHEGIISFTSNEGNEFTVILTERTPLGQRKFQCDVCGKEVE